MNTTKYPYTKCLFAFSLRKLLESERKITRKRNKIADSISGSNRMSKKKKMHTINH